jgi:hypothetical protein
MLNLVVRKFTAKLEMVKYSLVVCQRLKEYKSTQEYKNTQEEE